MDVTPSAPHLTALHFRLRPEVRRFQATRNLSQNELARRCGISSGYMSLLLRGHRCAGAEIRQRLLEHITGADFDTLFEEVTT
jgi:transcriptional regulator with XRE-family HTH domain